MTRTYLINRERVRRPFAIRTWDTAAMATGSAEIVSDDVPEFQKRAVGLRRAQHKPTILKFPVFFANEWCTIKDEQE